MDEQDKKIMHLIYSVCFVLIYIAKVLYKLRFK